MKKLSILRKLLKSLLYIFRSNIVKITNIKDNNYLPINPVYSDVYLNSFPRSGNTYLSFLITNINLIKSKSDLSVNFFNIHQFVPDIDSGRDIGKNLLPFPNFRIIKSHAKFHKDYKFVIYILRNPFDVMLSYYSFHKNLNNFNDSFSKFIRSDLYGIKNWVSHVNSWTNNLNAEKSFILIKYEDLVEDPVKELSILYEQLGLNISIDIIEKAVELSSKTNLKKLEKQLNYGDRIGLENFKVVNSKNDKEQILMKKEDKEFIKEYSINILRKFGYSENL